jgi:hypothetical protein
LVDERGDKVMNQELFDTVATHLLRQGRKAETERGVCKYRTDDGLKCAVGVLIPDELYCPIFEGVSIGEWINNPVGEADDYRRRGRMVSAAAGVFQDQLPLVSALQKVHDLRDVANWRDELKQVAKEFDLDPKVLDNDVL